MDIKYHPDEKTVRTAISNDDPLLVLVRFDGTEVIVCNIDDAGEHVILLRKMNLSELLLNQYFRLVVNREAADLIGQGYNDGIDIISKGLKALGYEKTRIEIPDRYRRHFNEPSVQTE